MCAVCVFNACFDQFIPTETDFDFRLNYRYISEHTLNHSNDRSGGVSFCKVCENIDQLCLHTYIHARYKPDKLRHMINTYFRVVPTLYYAFLMSNAI